MPIKFRCKNCNQLLGIASRKAGQSVRCPRCSASARVPTATDGRDVNPYLLAAAKETLGTSESVPQSSNEFDFSSQFEIDRVESAASLEHDNRRWYVAVARTRTGPFTLQQLRDLFEKGQLATNNSVLLEGAKKWCQASEIPGLFDIPAVVMTANEVPDRRMSPNARFRLKTKQRSAILATFAGFIIFCVLLICFARNASPQGNAENHSVDSGVGQVAARIDVDDLVISESYLPQNLGACVYYTEVPGNGSERHLLKRSIAGGIELVEGAFRAARDEPNAKGELGTMGPRRLDLIQPMRIRSSAPIRQVRNGFVEEGITVAPTKNIEWDRVLKIGARKGDSWDSAFSFGSKKVYSVTEFGQFRLAFEATSRRTVSVRTQLFSNGQLISTSDSIYVENAGLLQRDSFNAKMQLMGRIYLYHPRTDLTIGDRIFFNVRPGI